jgi:uncharacterized protein
MQELIMFNPNPVGWFEIPVLDLQRARHFYHHVFAVEFEIIEMGADVMAMFPFDHAMAGCSGALVQGPDYEPCSTGTMVYFACADVAPTLEKVSHGGGTVLLGKTSIGEHGYIAVFLDSEGNKVGMHSQQ